ncbi:hypothetical protein PspLS_04424 [Pyricularia sp. CBS 133598]|nr:hypothetical protein PspLS_04424 [Pyricularia sp. CBS 133598]
MAFKRRSLASFREPRHPLRLQTRPMLLYEWPRCVQKVSWHEKSSNPASSCLRTKIRMGYYRSTGLEPPIPIRLRLRDGPLLGSRRVILYVTCCLTPPASVGTQPGRSHVGAHLPPELRLSALSEAGLMTRIGALTLPFRVVRKMTIIVP